jgi:hypothetical protein
VMGVSGCWGVMGLDLRMFMVSVADDCLPKSAHQID